MILQGNLCIYRLFLPIRLAFCPFPAIISKSRQSRLHFTCSRQSGRPFFTILLYPEIIASAFVRSDNFSLQNRLCSMQGLYIPWFSLHQKRRGMSRLPDAMLPFLPRFRASRPPIHAMPYYRCSFWHLLYAFNSSYYIADYANCRPAKSLTASIGRSESSAISSRVSFPLAIIRRADAFFSSSAFSFAIPSAFSFAISSAFSFAISSAFSFAISTAFTFPI